MLDRIPVQQLHIGMLGIAVMAIVLPAGFYNAFAELDSNQSEQAQDAEAVRSLSSLVLKASS